MIMEAGCKRLETNQEGDDDDGDKNDDDDDDKNDDENDDGRRVQKVGN